MDFKEFKEKYFGKSVEEIKELFSIDKSIFKQVEFVDIVVRASNIANNILSFEHSIDYFYIFKEDFLIFVSELDLFLNIENIPDGDNVNFEDYDCTVRDYLTKQPSIKMFEDMISRMITSSHFDTINDLRKALEETNISSEDIEKTENALNSLFEGQSTERLKLIESILEYNDPNLKKIKDFIYDPKIQMKENSNNKNTEVIQKNEENTVVEEGFKVAQNIKNAGDAISNTINSTPMVKAVNDELKEAQKKRIAEYKEDIDLMLKKEENK